MKKYIFTFITAILVMLVPMAAAAAESDKMPDIDDTKKSLTIHFYVQNSGVEVPISGAEIAIYKVADLNCENGSADFTLLSQYNSLKKDQNGKDVTFDGLSGTQAEELSKELADLVTNADAVGITDISGEYTFGNLSQGMYLVIESNSYQNASEYEIIVPYLVSVPLAVKDNNGNYWKYDVISEPKTKIEPKTIDESKTSSDESTDTNTSINSDTDITSDKNSDSNKITDVSGNTLSVTSAAETSNPTPRFFDINVVKTGVVSNLMIFLMVLFGSAFFIVLTANKKKGEDDDEKKS